jgi:predicted nucleotidyltransferase component of viral defense system
MTKRPLTDVGTSVRARLLRLAHERGEDFQLVLTRYANERFLFRLASSKHASRFVLKGAALFTVWTGKPHRATRDLDLLGFGDPGVDHVRSAFTEVLTTEVPDDGVHFDVATMSVGPIRKDQEYGGIRVEIVAGVKAARLRLQVDVGFGDAVTPEARLVEFPALLDFPAPSLRAYPRETVVAEKLEAMVYLGMATSRMKDIYDLAILARDFDFDGDLLVEAIRATFERRGTSFPPGMPAALTAAFAADRTKQNQWSGFVRKAGVTDVRVLDEAIAAARIFCEAPLGAAAGGTLYQSRWPAGGPWAR